MDRLTRTRVPSWATLIVAIIMPIGSLFVDMTWIEPGRIQKAISVQKEVEAVELVVSIRNRQNQESKMELHIFVISTGLGSMKTDGHLTAMFSEEVEYRFPSSTQGVSLHKSGAPDRGYRIEAVFDHLEPTGSFDIILLSAGQLYSVPTLTYGGIPMEMDLCDIPDELILSSNKCER